MGAGLPHIRPARGRGHKPGPAANAGPTGELHAAPACAQGKEKCSKADWDAFEPSPVKGLDTNDFVAMLMLFAKIAKMCIDNKDVVTASLKA